MRVGFIGLGMMGKDMAANLQKAGFAPAAPPVRPERPTRSREGLGVRIPFPPPASPSLHQARRL